MSIKILNALEFANPVSPQAEKLLTEAGGRWVSIPNGLKPQEANEFINREIEDADGMIGWQLKPEHFALAKKLKWFHVPFAGVNRLLETCPALVDSAVTVTNGSGTMSGPMADTIMGYILVFNRRFLEHFRNQQAHKWGNFEITSVTELSQQTLGIVGYGRIGADTARRAKAFGLRVIATKGNPSGNYPELDEVWPSTELPRLLKEADYILIAAPLTPETEGMIGREQFELMKSTALIMNVGRGSIIKQDELIEALQTKKIGGAALDVTDPEPLPGDSPLWALENVFITPHASSLSSQVPVRMMQVLLKNLQHFVAGEQLINIVDLKRGY